MATECAKVRFAMGVFDDALQLDKAVAALIALGLDPEGLCFAAGRAAPAGDGSKLGTPAGATSEMTWFNCRSPAPEIASDSPSVVPLIAGALNDAITPGRRRSPASEARGTVNQPLKDGAFLLVALPLTVAQQKQAARALLPPSRQPVHAGEFPSSAEPVCRGHPQSARH
jgi:hypothetical protein